MAKTDKYINPLTDLDFKKVFKKLFESAEIAKFNKEEKQAYEESLKYYRDLKNVVDTSKQEGLEEGIEKRNIEIIKKGLQEGLSMEMMVTLTGLDIETIKKIQNQN